MKKRFTDCDKWDKQWFRRMPPAYKCAWQYLLDHCDPAGVIRVDEELAEFQIGSKIEWEDFYSACADRIARLADGKILIVGFVEFQYGFLSPDCQAHKPVFESIRRHEIERVLEGYLKGIGKGSERLQDKDKEKDKDKVLEGVQGETFEKAGWIIPERLDTPEVRKELDAFAKMRTKIKKPIRDFANTSRVFKHFQTAADLLFVLDLCITNEWQGIKPEYLENRNKSGTVNPRQFLTKLQQQEENMRQTRERLVAKENQQNGQVLIGGSK